jgi:serine/threonine-protein kinase
VTDQPRQPEQPPGPGTTKRRDLFRRAEDTFFEVAMLSPADRESAIARLCEGQPELEAEVRSLLASADNVGAFLGKPALGRDAEQIARDAALESNDELIGATLGAYRILHRHAAGGMGTVYLAERADGQFEQKVAVKVVKRGMDSEEILRRFSAERQTLAALDHPNIARLIDAGATPDGRPFLVMEMVEGLPIDRYCDHNRLGVRERLALFRLVCDAVQHAHQHLVIHRDIKPGNILVTAQGVPKLLDFGISKLLDPATKDQSLTAETDRRLTPEYASPEQVEGRSVTTATDVYSLGVVLYELLTGARPYHLAVRTTEELKRVVCLTLPPVPSSAVALSASRAGMPASTKPRAAPPAPASSHSPSRAARTAVAPTTAAAAPASPPTDIPKTRGVTSTKLRAVLRGDIDNIVMLALRKEPARRYVSVEQFAADITRYLEGMPVRARRDTLGYRASKFVRRHRFAVIASAAAVAMLAGATVALSIQSQRLAAQRDDLIATNHALEETRNYLVAVLGGAETGNLGPDAKLADVLHEATRALEQSPPDDPATRAASQLALGRALMSLGVLPRARELLEAADASLAALPTGTSARNDARTALAELLFFEGKHAEAEKAFRTLLAEERANPTAAPRGAAAASSREGLLLNNLGAALRLQGKADDAIATQREALAVRQRDLPADALPIAESYNNIGSALFQKGDVQAAAENLSKALEIRRKRLRPDHPLIVRCLSNLGLAELRLDRPQEAVEHLRTAADAWDKAFGSDHPGRVATTTSLAQALRKVGRHEEAIHRLETTLQWQRAHLPADENPDRAPSLAATRANIALARADAGQTAQARAELEAVTPILNAAGDAYAAIAEAASERLDQLRAASSTP